MATEALPIERAEQTQEQPANGHTLDSVIDATLRQKAETIRIKEAEFAFQQRRAQMFMASGLFSTTRDATPTQAVAQAMARIELGESMGFTAAESLQGIYIVSGQLCIASALRASRFQGAGYSWDIDWHWSGQAEASECTGCTLWLKYREKPLLDRAGKPVKVSYLKADAQKMLTKMDGKRVSILEKDNWKMTPQNMYFARVVTNAQRWYGAGVLSISIPSLEEVMDQTEEHGFRPPRMPEAETPKPPKPNLLEKVKANQELARDTGGELKSAGQAVTQMAERVEKPTPAWANAEAQEKFCSLGISERIAKFAEVKDKLVQMFGTDLADSEYTRVLDKHGAKKAGDIQEATIAWLAYVDLLTVVEAEERQPSLV